jgi:hypothetical protein
MAKPAVTSKIYKAWWPRALEVAAQEERPNFVELAKEWGIKPLAARDRYIRAKVEASKRPLATLKARQEATTSAAEYLKLLGAQIDELSQAIKDSVDFLDASAVKMTPEVKPKSRVAPPDLWKWVVEEIAEALTTKGAAAALQADPILVEGWMKGRIPNPEYRRRIRMCFASIWSREDFLDPIEVQEHQEIMISRAAEAVEDVESVNRVRVTPRK